MYLGFSQAWCNLETAKINIRKPSENNKLPLSQSMMFPPLFEQLIKRKGEQAEQVGLINDSCDVEPASSNQIEFDLSEAIN